MYWTENDLWRAILPVIRTGVAAFPGVEVKRAYQPATQADGENARVLLHRVSSRRRGFQGKKTILRDGKQYSVETWIKEDKFQADALVDRAPEDEGYTARDILEGLCGHLQSRAAVEALRNNKLGILRVREVMETPYEDAGNTFRVRVSTRFTLTYAQVMEREIPKINRVVRGSYRV